MTTKKTPTKKVVAKKEPVAPKAKAVNKPKFRLISYTLKAVIPVGQYANIQPEVTVQAETIEAAERAVMPYIETLFAKYRDGGVKPIEPVVTRPVGIVAPTVVPTPATISAATPVPIVDKKTDDIVLAVPFKRAKGAIDSCLSVDALKLVSDQVEKSTKLIDAEKVELKKLVTAKFEQLNGPKKV